MASRTDPARAAAPAGARMRGAALLLVLWLITLLTALVGGFALVSRVEALQGRVLVSGASASAVARAGLEYALTRIDHADPRLQWAPNGTPHAWRFGGAEVEVVVIDENGRVDLNHADATLLGGLLERVGVEPLLGARLAGAIVDWRDPDPLTQPSGGGEDADYASAGLPYGAKDAPFESVAELEQVLGFTPDIYDRLVPHVTVFSGRARPDAAFAPAEVLDAMGMDGAAAVQARGEIDPVTGLPRGGAAAGVAVETGMLVGSRSGTYSIASRARLADGRHSELRAVVRVGGSAVPGMAYTALHWQEGASPR